jgi:hypothetical protein
MGVKPKKHDLICKTLLCGYVAAVFGAAAGGCERTPAGLSTHPQDGVCDDGSQLVCAMAAPTCEEWETLAIIDGCYLCVNEATCRPWGEPECGSDVDCSPSEYCDPCGSSSCPNCRDCVAACVAHGCETQDAATCEMVRPDCGEGKVAVVADGCWTCVDLQTCAPARDTHCDDAQEPVCAMPMPTCQQGAIPAVRDGCWLCVNPTTCEPWGQGACQSDQDCTPAQWCNPCGTSSCPGCLDCVPACTAHGCETEPAGELTCYMARPECSENGVAVIRDGCWMCVDRTSCSAVRDESCDDGTVPTCDMVEPECGPHEILAHRRNCYQCVNPATCLPWGEAECLGDIDCPATDYCDPCGSSACPGCEDCVPACLPHNCPTEDQLICNAMRPECRESGVAVITSGCWECVDIISCEPLPDNG